MPIRCVILDVDGTLVDSNDAHAEAFVRTFAEYGYDVEFEKVKRMIGMGGDRLMRHAIDLDIESPRGKEIDKRRSDLFMNEYLPNLKGFPGARDLVERIQQQGQRVVIASVGDFEVLVRAIESHQTGAPTA